MKKNLLFLFSMVTIYATSQPDSFAFTTDVSELGSCNFELYRYSTRSPTQEVFLWDGGEQFTSYTPGIVRTYRGRINNYPNYRVFAVWYPDNELYKAVQEMVPREFSLVIIRAVPAARRMAPRFT